MYNRANRHVFHRHGVTGLDVRPLGSNDVITFLQTLRVLYTPSIDRAKVNPDAMLEFLRSVGGYNKRLVNELVLAFKGTYYQEFVASNLQHLA